MQADTSYHVNLGTDRPNIAWFVRRMTGAKKDFKSLAFLIPEATDDELTELVQTMVFFDDINVALEAMKWIRSRLPPHLHSQVTVYNSRRSKRAKDRVLRDYQKGHVKILLTTEAAGMVRHSQRFFMIKLNIVISILKGCDLPHVEQVIQFMVPLKQDTRYSN
jgi:superfamily II DNA/RNA helicase